MSRHDLVDNVAPSVANRHRQLHAVMADLAGIDIELRRHVEDLTYTWSAVGLVFACRRHRERLTAILLRQTQQAPVAGPQAVKPPDHKTQLPLKSLISVPAIGNPTAIACTSSDVTRASR